MSFVSNKKFEKAYIVTVDMGYGHQRAVYPLKDIAASPVGWGDKGLIITANNYAGIPRGDRVKWESGRKIYEKISRMKRLPVVGNYIFGLMDYLQRIEPFYPNRDLSKPTLQVKQLYSMVRGGMGKHLIDELNKNPLPYITSFFTTAFFAEVHGYKGDIYCLCTDTDVSRAWVSLEPKKSRIHYFAPNKRVKERLILYGVREKMIFVTGFPLPKENIGDNALILKQSLARRIINLDPEKKFQHKYRHTLEHYLGKDYDKVKSKHPLTLMFAVGGAGAQREIGGEILKSLKTRINNGELKLILVAGSRNDVYRYYSDFIDKNCKKSVCNKYVEIIYDENKLEYFKKMNKALLTTDIVWTKPSEMSFYAGLGLPIIMSPTIGSQENFNRAWLHSVGAGVEQENPIYADEWLFDWLKSGWLAQAAMEGFLDAPRNGAYHIEDIVLRGKRSEIEDMHLL